MLWDCAKHDVKDQNEKHLMKWNGTFETLFCCSSWLLKECWVCVFKVAEACGKWWGLP